MKKFGSLGLVACSLGLGYFMVTAGPVTTSDVDTALFDGAYRLDTIAFAKWMIPFDSIVQTADDTTRTQMLAARHEIERQMRSSYDNFTVRRGVIRSGAQIVQEIRFIDGAVAGDSLRGRAIWHEDIHDPGDYVEQVVTLRLLRDTLQLIVHDESGKPHDVARLIRK